MAIMLKRQLTEAEKQRVLEVHGRNCFATGHPIPNGEPVHFDHIRAFAQKGLSEIDNIAPMCDPHNRAKGALPLEDFRTKLRLQDFFRQGDSLTLKHLLGYMKDASDIASYGQSVVPHESDGGLVLETATSKTRYALHDCPATGWKYFYATLPVEVIDSDDDRDERIGLQPRYLIFDKVFELYRHFQDHPVLQPSIGRIHQNRILLFDGQHKIAALLWNGRRSFECKVYVDPDVHLLNQTNIAAHDKFSQTRFFSSVMVTKLGREFGAEFVQYRNMEDGQMKSEQGFMAFLRQREIMTGAELNKRFRSYLYNSVLEVPENNLARFVSQSNRSTDEKPLTIDMLSKSLFACFLYTEPVPENMATEAYKRDEEIENVITLMNALYELALRDWNPKVGPNDSQQMKLTRLFRSKSIMAWSELLRDAICGKLDLQDAEDRARPFYREFTDIEISRIKSVARRAIDWKLWSSPANTEIDRVLAGNKSDIKDWFRSKGLTTGYLMGAAE